MCADPCAWVIFFPNANTHTHTHTSLLRLMLVSLAYNDLWNSKLEVEVNPRSYMF